MSIVSLKACAQCLKLPYTGSDIYFSSISIDTRTLKPGALFIAVQGTDFDGHDFIELACQKKAAAVITQFPLATKIPYLQVKDTRKALGMLARYHRQQFNLPIIALTGSCGKTTTKEYLSNILKEYGSTLTAQKSFNNDIGVPLTLLKLNSTHQFAVLEMGANALGEIAWLTHLAQPTIAMILNIGSAHLEGFGSLQGVAQAKTEILQGLSPTDIGIIHTNVMKTWGHFIPKAKKIILYGSHEKSRVSAHSISLDSEGKAKFILIANAENIPIQLSLLGLHQVDNALAAATAAVALNIPSEMIKIGLESTQPISGRLNSCISYHGANILDDTYNANPDSVKASLDLLKHYKNKRILVLGDLAELGENSQALLASIGHYARELGIDQLLSVGSSSAEAGRAFGKHAFHFTEQKALIHALDQQLDAYCTVLIKGSRNSDMEKVVQALTK